MAGARSFAVPVPQHGAIRFVRLVSGANELESTSFIASRTRFFFSSSSLIDTHQNEHQFLSTFKAYFTLVNTSSINFGYEIQKYDIRYFTALNQ